MKIQYVGNTCDIDELGSCGEILIAFKDGIPIFHHDYSDGALEVDYISSLLKPFGIDIKFESIVPTKKQIKEMKKYLSRHGYDC